MTYRPSKTLVSYLIILDHQRPYFRLKIFLVRTARKYPGIVKDSTSGQPSKTSSSGPPDSPNPLDPPNPSNPTDPLNSDENRDYDKYRENYR